MLRSIINHKVSPVGTSHSTTTTSLFRNGTTTRNKSTPYSTLHSRNLVNDLLSLNRCKLGVTTKHLRSSSTQHGRNCGLSSSSSKRPLTKNVNNQTSHRHKSTIVPSNNIPRPPPPTTTTLTITSLRSLLHSFLLKPRTLPLPRWITPRHFSVTISEMCGHASFILVALSYAVDDFLMLRIIAVAGSTSMLFFTYFHPHGRVLWLPFKWNLLFIAINCYRIGKNLTDEYLASRLSGEMIKLRNEHVSAVSMVDFAKLVQGGEIIEFRSGDKIMDQGEPNPYVYLLVDGRVDCFRDGICTYHVTRGDFVSENGIHAGLDLVGLVESSVTIMAFSGGDDNDDNDKVRCLRWNRTELTKLLRDTPSLKSSLQSVISLDIVRKLKKQRQLLTKKIVSNPALWTQKRNEQNFYRYLGILKNLLSHRGHLQRKRNQIDNYRLIHDIDDDMHVMALQKCGWTLEEYNLGYQKAGLLGDGDRRQQRYNTTEISKITDLL